MHQVLLDSFKVAHHALDHLFLVADFVPDRLKLLVQLVCLSQVDEAGELELVLLTWGGFGVVAGVFIIVGCWCYLLLLLQELLLEVDKLLVDALEAVDDLLYLLARADELLLKLLDSALALFG